MHRTLYLCFYFSVKLKWIQNKKFVGKQKVRCYFQRELLCQRRWAISPSLCLTFYRGPIFSLSREISCQTGPSTFLARPSSSGPQTEAIPGGAIDCHHWGRKTCKQHPINGVQRGCYTPYSHRTPHSQKFLAQTSTTTRLRSPAHIPPYSPWALTLNLQQQLHNFWIRDHSASSPPALPSGGGGENCYNFLFKLLKSLTNTSIFLCKN